MQPVHIVLLAVAGPILLLAAVGMVRSWRRRVAGDATAWPLPETFVADRAEGAILRDELSYVATTLADDPLHRIAAGGLGFRGPAEVAVHPAGLVLEVRGAAPLHVRRESLLGVGRGTFAIDRAVEPDGLVVVGWTWQSTPVDLYLKPASSARGRALIEAIAPLVPPRRLEQPDDPNPHSTY